MGNDLYYLTSLFLFCFHSRKEQSEHQSALTEQLLQSRAVSHKWHDVIVWLANRVCQTVKPDVRGARESSNINHYVKIKKVVTIT